MSVTAIGTIGIIALFVLLALRMPVAMTMLIIGFVGTIAISGWEAALSTLGGEAFEITTTGTLIVVPLFVLMGNLAGVSGMSRDLYEAAYAWVGHRRGGLASATIVGCAGFAAMSGSSIASAVTMGRVAIPEMKRYNYDDSLATGAVAAGGTLGILIPPSTGMIIFAILTEQSIGRLFMAGVLPGLLLTALFLIAIYIVTRRRPEAGPPGPKADLAQRLATLKQASAIVGIVAVTIGGIYLGVFTPVEAAGVGAFLTLVISFARGALDRQKLQFVILQTLQTTATVFMILIGAFVFIPFMALTQIPSNLVTFLVGLDVGQLGVLIIILVTYIALGTFLEGLAMLVLTLHITFPVIVAMGLDPIWFGVVVVIVLEMGLISPPVGVNVFVVKSVAPDVPMGTIFRGIWPFWLAMGVCLVFLVAFPQIALWLPNTMFGGG
ncbi:MAG: TRAP transporter large permease [Rhodospirillaceae bacterium]|jgi:tripartite ATP-independent transporter DctM subunit|nr:TRAP transporter large permease [Rhodospirillaceae bacterium]MBT3885645.1 TRAP transporter large permease [Rhodospirillaceae bacterium]MBT4117058.1 TRAP transporter large permease [Rhodospirillaceae bacterium]MBT4672283.1 TRAP transporter large permease [Rhodospirillaceae bacterium]MBT4721949.1 TRAP transporter large permease [Rhodospirillaceae bacterium]